jgi:hypothetical protein
MLFAAVHESAIGTKQTFRDRRPMSAFRGKADMRRTSRDVRVFEKAPDRVKKSAKGWLPWQDEVIASFECHEARSPRCPGSHQPPFLERNHGVTVAVHVNVREPMD